MLDRTYKILNESLQTVTEGRMEVAAKLKTLTPSFFLNTVKQHIKNIKTNPNAVNPLLTKNS